MKNIVVAYDKGYVIGENGALPWAGHLPADMKRFREITTGDSVIMGRKTFESLPDSFRPLPGRQNIILSLGEVAGTGFQVAHSLDKAYALAEHEEVHVIGGGQIYKAAFDTIDRVYATEIDTVVEGADTYFPAMHSNEWHETEREAFPANERNMYGYSFVTYLRNNPID